MSFPYRLFVIVKQQEARIIERGGKFWKSLPSGLKFLIPFYDKVAYTHSLKEEVYPISSQTAITKDNVTIHLDAVLYLKIVDPYKASYGVGNPIVAAKQLAQTSMRSELGKLTFDKTFEEREHLNNKIVKTINQAGEDWGIMCMRYEIRDIAPPPNIRKAMELQAESERRKRSQILTSEGKKISNINVAEGDKQAMILKAEGHAEAVLAKSKANAYGIETVAKAIKGEHGELTVGLQVARKYIKAYKNLTTKGKAVIVPKDSGHLGSSMAQLLGVYQSLAGKKGEGSSESSYGGFEPLLQSTDEE